MKSNCYKCGRFVGKDGNHDISYDDYAGGYEQGYPECRPCIDKANKKYDDARMEQAFKLFLSWFLT